MSPTDDLGAPRRAVVNAGPECPAFGEEDPEPNTDRGDPVPNTDRGNPSGGLRGVCTTSGGAGAGAVGDFTPFSKNDVVVVTCAWGCCCCCCMG